MEKVVGSSKRTSKSEVSRTWEKKANEYIEILRSRPLDAEAYVVLMLDGVVLSDDLTAVVALGITADGKKQLLDFEIGSSENSAVCCALTDRLVERGITLAARRPLVVLDGAKSLRRAVRKHWPDAMIQTCLVHVARLIRGKLARRHHKEMERLFNRIRAASDLEAAMEAFDSLRKFVGRYSAAGLKSLEFASEEMLTLFELGVPDAFNKPLLSTNSIENSIRNMRQLLGRVTRWRGETDMASRWMACAMIEAEKGFRRIQGHQEMHLLIEALDRSSDEETERKNSPMKKGEFSKALGHSQKFQVLA